jgi:MatE
MPPQTLEQTQQHHAHEDTPLLVGNNISDFDVSEKSWFARTFQEIVVQSKTALPTLQSMVFTKIPWLISLRFVGGMGAPQLAAAALATTLCNVTGMALSVGLSSALSTLSGQAKGELVSRMLHEKHRRVSFDLAESIDVTTSPQPIIGSPSSDEPITTIIFFWR